MTPEAMRPGRSVFTAILGLFVALLGLVLFNHSRLVIHRWDAIGSAYATCLAGQIIAGAAMVAGGLWTLASLGRRRAPVWLAGAGSVLSGAIIIVGVLSYAIPCSGPS